MKAKQSHNNPENIASQATAARKAGDHRLAAKLYSEMRESTPQAFAQSPWNLWGLAQCLISTGRAKDALEICREMYRTHNDFKPGLELYARCIYRNAFSTEGETPGVAVQEKAAEAILALSPQKEIADTAETVCLATLAILKLATRISRENLPAAPRTVLEWTGRLDPDHLSREPFAFEDAKGRKISTASHLEQWHSLRARALHGSGDHAACIELCEQALREIPPPLHHGNEVWFRRLAAKSRAAVGDKEGALDLYKQILSAKEDWFLLHEHAVLLRDTGGATAALARAAQAALAPGDPAMKVRLFSLMADLLLEAGRPGEAASHATLVRDLYLGNNWPIARIMGFLRKHDTAAPEELAGAPADLLAKCGAAIREMSDSLWPELSFAGQAAQTGRISSILPNGKAGFVSAGKNRSYYFSLRDFAGPRGRCAPGARVSFFLKEGFDRRKNRPAKNAVHLKLIKESAND